MDRLFLTLVYKSSAGASAERSATSVCLAWLAPTGRRGGRTGDDGLCFGCSTVNPDRPATRLDLGGTLLGPSVASTVSSGTTGICWKRTGASEVCFCFLRDAAVVLFAGANRVSNIRCCEIRPRPASNGGVSTCRTPTAVGLISTKPCQGEDAIRDIDEGQNSIWVVSQIQIFGSVRGQR